MNGFSYCLLFTAISMSLGWRIRGQFGHEIGAAIPGALGGLAVALASGRKDWWRRIPFFALFSALGWCFGGSISYMKVVMFCHSSDSLTVLYGFAGLFLIGFLWAGLGGAGTALSAALDDVSLARMFPVFVAVLAAWFLQGLIVDWYCVAGRTLLYWYDTDWLQAAVAFAAVLFVALLHQRTDIGMSLIFHLTLGWWIGFLILVNLLGWHLSPPRGDNWSGCVGLFAGLMIWCGRWRLVPVASTALVTGVLGGTGFCAGQMLKLVGACTQTFAGLHVTMEWMQGLFLGLALAVGMAPLVRRGQVLNGNGPQRWHGIVALWFVLWVIPYLNACRIPERWTRDGKFPETVHGMELVGHFLVSRGCIGWIESLFLPFGAMMLLFLVGNARRRLPFVPDDELGRGQLLYLVFLWGVGWLSGSIEIAGLLPTWFVTQWAITLHILLCTWLLLAGSYVPWDKQQPVDAWRVGRTAIVGILVAAATALSGWGLKTALFGNRFAGYVNTDHIRYGPNNTNHVK